MGDQPQPKADPSSAEVAPTHSGPRHLRPLSSLPRHGEMQEGTPDLFTSGYRGRMYRQVFNSVDGFFAAFADLTRRPSAKEML